MSVSIEIQADEILESMSQGKIKYETKRAVKQGFKTLREYILSKLNGGESPANSQYQVSKVPNPIKKPPWQQGTSEQPIFDMSFIRNLVRTKGRAKGNKPKVVKGLIPNKAMLEWWLLDVGSQNPNNLTMGETGRGTINQLNLEICFFKGELMVDTKHHKYNGNHVYIWFRDLQHTIKNNEMFWLLFGTFYTENEKSLNPTELEKPERNNIPLNNRIKLPRILQPALKAKHFQKIDLGFLDEYDEDDEIPIFRTFSVQTKRRDENGKQIRGKPVRKGITRLSDEGGIHMDGKGYSYSTSKALAMRLGYPINIPIIRKHCQVDEKGAEKILKKWATSRQLEFITMYGGFYRALGHFTVKKKNIKLFTNTRQELEIIANPEDVVLKDYRFLNAVDFMATNIFINLLENLKIPPSELIDLDHVYEAFHRQIKCGADNDRNLIKKYLQTKGSNRINILEDHVLKGFYQAIHGKTPPQIDWRKDITSIETENGYSLSFHDHSVKIRKPYITVYQTRLFKFTKDPTLNFENPTNLLLGVGGSPTNVWCN